MAATAEKDMNELYFENVVCRGIRKKGTKKKKLSWCENAALVNRDSVTAATGVEDVEELGHGNADLDGFKKSIDGNIDFWGDTVVSGV